MMGRFSVGVLLTVVLLGASAAGAAGSSWSVQTTPNPSGATLSYLAGVSCTTGKACTAVGYYGSSRVTLAERWNGTKWSLQSTPNPTSATSIVLNGVSCTSASACTAVGSYDNGATTQTLAERWNGTKWSIQTTPNRAGATQSLLNGVSCTSASACTAVGSYANASAAGVVVERWNGTGWKLQKAANPASSTLSGVSCVSATACTAVGDYYNGDTTVPLAERWNGTKWSIEQTPTGGHTGIDLDGVSCTSTSACTAVGYYTVGFTYYTLAERWNGTKWSVQTTPNPTSGGVGNPLLGVSCTSASACTAVGYYTNGTDNGTDEVTLAEHWNGTKWWIQTTPSPGSPTQLLGVSCVPGIACTAVGYSEQGNDDLTLAERSSGG